MVVYVTHCSAKKRKSGRPMSPIELYTSKRAQAFMRRCVEMRVRWAIFSDQYGVWFPDTKRRWYELSPDAVTDDMFIHLVRDFDIKLRRYTKIFFYYHPARFHRLYRRLVRTTIHAKKIVLIRHVALIG